MIDVMNEKRRVAIIGGGITGLTAAYFLQQKVREQQLPVEIVLIESTHRLGGKIHTILEDGYQIEKGPASFTDHRGTVAELAGSLGLTNKLINSMKDKKFVAVNEELYAVPEGVQFGIPTKMKPFMASDLVSWSGKARVTFDFLRPQTKLSDDQSLGNLLRNRLGNEVVENITEPLLSGIYNGDIDQLSVDAVLPFLSQYGNTTHSLINGVKAYTQAPEFLIDHQTSFSFIGGLSTLIDELENQITDVKVKKSERVLSIKQLANNQLTLSLNNTSTIKADAVFIAAPHTVAQSLLEDKSIFCELKDMPLNTIATVSLMFDEQQISKRFRGTDIVISRNSDFSVTSATFMNRKWEHVAPKGKEMIKAYIGRLGDEAIVELSDKEIEKVILQDLHRLIGITGAPEKVVVSRFKNTMPQYTIGHAERVQKMKENLHRTYPMVRVGGNSYDGISLPKCISQAKENMNSLLEELF